MERSGCRSIQCMKFMKEIASNMTHVV